MIPTVGTSTRVRDSVEGGLGSDPSVVVVTATVRLAREIGRRHDQEQLDAGRTVWPSPEILPFDAWVARLWRQWLYSGEASHPLRLLRPDAERAVWEDIVRTSEEGGELLEVSRTAEAAMAAWQLAWRWEVPFDAFEWGDTADTEAFRRWRLEFEARARRNAWLSGARLPELVSRQIAAGAIEVPREIVVAGFDELPPAYAQLLEAARGRGARTDVRDGWWGFPAAAQGKKAVLAGFPDTRSEILAAAVWAREKLGDLFRGGDEGRAAGGEGRIGIVVPDLPGCRAQVEHIFAHELHPAHAARPEDDSRRVFNISLGLPLAAYPLVEAAFAVFRIDPDSMPIEDAGRLLRSPFIGGAEEEHTRRSLLARALCRQRELRVRFGTVLRLAGDDSGPCQCPLLADRLLAWRTALEALPARLGPSEWVPALSGLLRAIGWPGDRTLDGVLAPLSLRQAVAELERIARSRLFQPESEPAPVQILGLFEAGGLRFGHLWVLGMHEDAWPGSGSPNPFLPLRLQRRHDVPGSSPEHDLEFARRITERLLSSAPEIVVSYPQREGDLPLRPSPLFAALPEARPGGLGLPPPVGFLERVRRSSRIEILGDHRAPPWSGNGAPLAGGTALFRDQAACPFRAFARARLGAGVTDDARPGLDVMDRGSLVHDILERVWAELESHRRLVAMTSGSLARVVRAAVASSLGEMSARRSILGNPDYTAIEQKRLEALVVDWLGLEKQRRPFQVVQRETRIGVEVSGIPLLVRADRVDQLEDGSKVLVDYKTRPATPQAWEGDRPDEPQLPIYATHTLDGEKPLSGVFFGVIRKGKPAFRGAAVSDGIVPGVSPRSGEIPLDRKVGDWRRVLDRLGREFREGRALVDPKKGLETCRHCNLGPLCRIHESAEETAHEDAEPADD